MESMDKVSIPEEIITALSSEIEIERDLEAAKARLENTPTSSERLEGEVEQLEKMYEDAKKRSDSILIERGLEGREEEARLIAIEESRGAESDDDKDYRRGMEELGRYH
ncbi:MAG: hypothetical protein AAB632_02455 [Patescibacteria group bacterium]